MRLYCYSTSRCGKSVSAGQKMWIKFYPAFIYCTGKVVQTEKNLKWESIRKEDLVTLMWCIQTYDLSQRWSYISDIWSYYDDDFQTCYQNIINDMGNIQRCQKDPKGKGQPPNFFCISCVPSDGFHRLQHMGANEDRKSVSSVVWKICHEERRGKLSAALTISHASLVDINTKYVSLKDCQVN